MTPQTFTPFRGRRPAAARVALLASLLCLCAVGVVTSSSQNPIQDTLHERELEDGIPDHLPIKVKVKNPDKFKDLKNERWLGDLELEVKPHPKKIGLRFEALNFGDGTGFVTTEGLPVPEERGACEGGREGRATTTARIRPGPPPATLFRKASFFLPATFLPVNFFSADTRQPASGESAPQSCCPGTQCERMRIILEGNCFCDDDSPATEAASPSPSTIGPSTAATRTASLTLATQSTQVCICGVTPTTTESRSRAS